MERAGSVTCTVVCLCVYLVVVPNARLSLTTDNTNATDRLIQSSNVFAWFDGGEFVALPSLIARHLRQPLKFNRDTGKHCMSAVELYFGVIPAFSGALLFWQFVQMPEAPSSGVAKEGRRGRRPLSLALTRSHYLYVTKIKRGGKNKTRNLEN